MRQTGRFPSAYIHYVWYPITAFILAEFVVGFLTQAPVALPADFAVVKEAAWNEAAARMQLLGMLLLFLISGLAIVVRFLDDLVHLFDAPSQKSLCVVYGLLVISGAVVVAAAYGGAIPRSYALVASPEFFDRALTMAQAFDPTRLWSPRAFAIMLGIVNIVTGIAVPAFVAGGISCLATFAAVEEKESWHHQSQRLVSYVYMSAAWLVIGTVFLKTWTQYPSFWLDKSSAVLHSAVVNAYTAFTGIEYTLILAAYALPTVLFMSKRAESIATAIARSESASTDGVPLLSLEAKTRAVREREKLVFSAQDIVKTIIAVLAPMLTGGIASLSSIVGKG